MNWDVNKKIIINYRSVTRTFFFFRRVLFKCNTKSSAKLNGTATKAQSCFSSIVPNSYLFNLPCLKKRPAISPLEILSFRPPEINKVFQYCGLCGAFSDISIPFTFNINSGSGFQYKETPLLAFLRFR